MNDRENRRPKTDLRIGKTMVYYLAEVRCYCVQHKII